ncbi:hypothetical protein QUA43_09520 [Microcoleus sp. N9_B4]
MSAIFPELAAGNFAPPSIPLKLSQETKLSQNARALIVPERLHPRNSKAFDWALTCVKQEGELRAIRVLPARD